MPELSIIIPAWNEEACIGSTLKHLIEVFDKNKVNYEMLLINQGSVDNTGKIAEQFAKKNKRLRVFNLPKNLSYGGGITYGFERAKGNVIGWTCADEEVSAEDTYKIYSVLKNSNYDVAKALRVDRKDGTYRKITTRVFNFISNLRFNLKIRDINGWPSFFKRKIYGDIRSEEKDDLYPLEVCGNIVGKGHKMVEVEVVHRERNGGKSCMKPFRVAKMVWKLFLYSLKDHGWSKRARVDSIKCCQKEK